jgi:mRNA interferase RelE/StbE
MVGAERTYRLRVGAYRVVYEIDDTARLVTVLYVRHRKDAYR